ncbi:MAG: hypothetical protein D6720_07990 [Gammaproteobacteria bacterium]|nr:MAG: hypothetical protein D6720_07990 [Gammaproteobacteria bacterium]
MLPPKSSSSAQERKLLRLFRGLDAQARRSLLDFARFLSAREGLAEVAEPVAQEPLGIPRPDQETVVQAIRRLSRNYPMLNRDELLHGSAALMSSHVLQGRPAAEVIDDLEAMFAKAWASYRDSGSESG